jgi:hypothetical protein
MSEKCIILRPSSIELKDMKAYEAVGLLRFWEKKIWLWAVEEDSKSKDVKVANLESALRQIAADTRELHPAIAEIATKALEGGNS